MVECNKIHARLVIKLFTSLKKEDGHVKQRDKAWLISLIKELM